MNPIKRKSNFLEDIEVVSVKKRKTNDSNTWGLVDIENDDRNSPAGDVDLKSRSVQSSSI